ncbi:MAG: TonB-dependent receptor [Bacteroides sp.]|nr:TonB-dependent receptor [Bacteroides sp.]
MRKSITLLTLAFSLSLGVSAQTIYDAANLTDKDLNGTARFVGMGGAMGALGGDISTINTNPAGIGIYRSNDAVVSFGLSSYGTESNYMGNSQSVDKLRGDFNNAGFVLSTHVSNVSALRYLNFAFNYQRVKSFYKNTQMQGNLGDFSQSIYMANQAYGITNWSNAYNNPDIGWLSALGYDGYLITDLIAQGELDQLIASNPGFSNYEPYMVNGVQAKNSNGELLFRTPGDYVGMYTGADGTFRSQERGGIDEFDFNLSANLNDRVYLGLTIGAYAVNYSKYSIYGEDYGSGEWYELQSWSKLEGAGFDLKFGAIFRPIATSPLRIGLAIHTPTFYNLDFKTSAVLDSDVWNNQDQENESGVAPDVIGQYTIDTYDKVGGDMVRKFRLQTPWTYNVSLGYTVGKNLALGAEFEYKDYSSVKFEDDESSLMDAYEFENSTTDMLKGVSTIKLGAEYKVIPEFALRLGYNYRSSIFDDNAYKNLPINSIQTDTDFSNTEALSNYTLGIGYRGSSFYADLAYKYTTYNAKFYPFDMFDGERLVQATKLNNTRSQVLLTLGMRF